MFKAQRPGTASKLSEVPMALLQWDNTLREYLEAGGKRPTYEEQKGALLNILPLKFREGVFFRIPMLQETLNDATPEGCLFLFERAAAETG